MALEITTANFEQEVTNLHKQFSLIFGHPGAAPAVCKLRFWKPLLRSTAISRITKCNVDDNPELAEKFAIMSIPSLLVFKSGKLVKSAVGLHDKEALAALVK